MSYNIWKTLYELTININKLCIISLQYYLKKIIIKTFNSKAIKSIFMVFYYSFKFIVYFSL